MVFICRLCGNDDYDLSGVEIFSEEGVNKALAYKIKLSLDISVYEYDPLPKYICKLCIEKLFKTFSFQEICRRTQIELRERVLTTESWSLNGTALNVYSEKQQNVSGEMLPRVISAETLQNSTSADAATPITLHGQPFEFSTFIRNGVLEDFAKVINGGDSQKSKPKNAKKTKQTNNSRRKQNKTSKEPSSLSESHNNLVPIETLVSNQVTALQLPNNIVSCSSGTPTHEATDSLPYFAPNQQDNSKPIQIVNVYSVQDPNNTSVTIPTTVNNSNPCISLMSGTQAVEIPMMDTTSYMTPVSTSVPISFIVTPNQPNAGRWHSPTLSNTLGSVNTVPDNFQWHTPSQTMSESAVQTPTSTEKSDKNAKKSTKKQARTNTTSKSIANITPKSPTNITPNATPNSTNATPKSTNTTPKSTTNTSGSRTNTTIENRARAQEDEDEDEKDDDDCEEEDDIFIVEVVKANKGSIAQHWEKCDEGYKCKDCKKMYKKLAKCENHIRTHLGIRPFECKLCKRRFLKRRVLNEHIITHIGKKLYQCKECPKAFRYRKNFKLHLEIHTEVVSRSYLCEICRRTFKSQYEYWNHKSSKHILNDTVVE